MPNDDLAPTSEPTSSLRSRSGIFLVVYFSGFLSFALLLFTCPLRSLEGFFYAALWMSPVWLALMLFLKPRIIAEYAELKSISNSRTKSSRQVSLFLSPLSLVFTLVALFWIANRFLDRAPAKTVTLTVIQKNWTTHKGSRSYHVVVESPVSSPFGDESPAADTVDIQSSEYDSVNPGRTTIDLHLHPGFLGLPWVERWHELHNINTGGALPKSPQSLAEIRAACDWTTHFNFDREIEKLKPDGERVDHWPNGHLRTHEPLVHGQTHGLAHYEFANGHTYGDIPWNHGHKHGVFTLFREDGSKEETLSYKEGRLYGLSSWFTPEGKVKARQVYLDDFRVFAGEACD